MSKLNIDQKNICTLFSDRKADFLIPDYQRPYAWQEAECSTLWDDIFAFAFPDDNCNNFDDNNDEYFLGPIVTFKNDDSKSEIIDGQQRLTTLMLLLRAFYERFGNMMDENSISTRETIAKCIWKTNAFGKPDKNLLKIDSEVASDNEKEEFLEILKTGVADSTKKSPYAQNYRYFQKRIEEFLNKYPSYFPYLPIRILNNCILLPIEAESQDTALRIFSTLNDRGKPLSDADIFKAQFYKYYTAKGQKNEFIDKWKYLEELSKEIFHPSIGTPMDELFTKYMYFERAKQGIKATTTEALRKFYEKDSYALFKNDTVIDNLKELLEFWRDIENQDDERFSDSILKKLFVLEYAPNGMWTYFTSVYFMQNKDSEGKLEEEAFGEFLSKITAFIWAYAITNPGVNALRTPVYAEMINIVNNKPVLFEDFKFDLSSVKNSFENFNFYNQRPITKSMLALWAFSDSEQPLISTQTKLEIEHIFPRARQEKEHSLSNNGNLESLGNKALLEKTINIRAAEYRFEDKKKFYNGYIYKGQFKEGTKNIELTKMSSNMTDFSESDIIERKQRILDAFYDYLKSNDLINE